MRRASVFRRVHRREVDAKTSENRRGVAGDYAGRSAVFLELRLCLEQAPHRNLALLLQK